MEIRLKNMDSRIFVSTVLCLSLTSARYPDYRCESEIQQILRKKKNVNIPMKMRRSHKDK